MKGIFFMNMKRHLLILTCFSLLFCLHIQSFNVLAAENSLALILKQGSRGNDVNELQERLKYLGYFHTKVTGFYGPITVTSVRGFQSKFGLPVDGIAGPKTWDKLRLATKDYKKGAPQTPKIQIPKSSNGFSSNELYLMARTVHAEARGEPYEGQVAVAAVILNRIKDADFPNTVSGVIYQKGAFSAVNESQFWLTPNETAKKAVQDAINGWDPSNGAVYYYSPKKVGYHRFMSSLPAYRTIGDHKFCGKKKW